MFGFLSLSSYSSSIHFEQHKYAWPFLPRFFSHPSPLFPRDPRCQSREANGWITDWVEKSPTRFLVGFHPQLFELKCSVFCPAWMLRQEYCNSHQNKKRTHHRSLCTQYNLTLTSLNKKIRHQRRDNLVARSDHLHHPSLWQLELALLIWCWPWDVHDLMWLAKVTKERLQIKFKEPKFATLFSAGSKRIIHT